MVAAAVIGGAVVGAAGSAMAGHSAANATKHAADQASADQKAALEQSKELSAPYRALGESAIPQLQSLLGLGPKGGSDILTTLRNLPGYEFLKEEGDRSVSSAAGATGMQLSGNTLAELQRRGQGLADTTYGEQVNRMLAPVQLGESSAAGQAANAMQTGSNLATIAGNKGSALADINSGTIAGITGSINKGIDGLVTQNTLAGLRNLNPSGVTTT